MKYSGLPLELSGHFVKCPPMAHSWPYPSGLLMSYQAIISLYCGDMPEWMNNKLDRRPQKLPVKQYTAEANPLIPVSAN